MRHCEWRGRKAASLENEFLRVTVLAEGGHIAELLDKATNINPLWRPPWTTREPSQVSYDDAAYGGAPEGKLLAGISGHNLCLDLFGAPDAAEQAAGMVVHGEAGVLPWQLEEAGDAMHCRVETPLAGLAFERRIQLAGQQVLFAESVHNLRQVERTIAWTQHVTLGPPFIAAGRTRIECHATAAHTYPEDFTAGVGRMKWNEGFAWPMAPALDGSSLDLQQLPFPAPSASFSAQRMKSPAWFAVHAMGMTLRYDWNEQDFPWLGLWEENRARRQAPWNGITLALGFEFGVSPFPESRAQMVARRQLYGAGCGRLIAAQSSLHTSYSATFGSAA
jgi:hypothetical protein